jgi:predicted dehydrogenase
LIDFLLWTFGDIERLSARLDTFIRTRRTEDGTERPVTSDDQNATLVHFANGGSGLIFATGISRAQRALIEAHGSKGSLSIENNQLQCAREPGKLERVDDAGPGGGNAIAWMTDYLGHVARVFRGEQDDNVATFEQGLRVQAVMDAIHASSDTGGERKL